MKRRVRRGRPELSRRPVIKGFEYDNYHEPVRIMMLCQGLKALRWVDGDMDMQAFIKLFSGDDVYQRIVWRGDINTLAELFRRLVNKRGLLKLPANHTLWTMVNGHFWNQESGCEFGNDRLRKAHCPVKNEEVICMLVNMLDPKYEVDSLYEMWRDGAI